MLVNLLTRAKAVVAFLAAEGAFLSTHGLSAAGHWFTHASAVVLALIVYFVPNKQAS